MIVGQLLLLYFECTDADWIKSGLRNASFVSCVFHSFCEKFIWETHGGIPIRVQIFFIAL